MSYYLTPLNEYYEGDRIHHLDHEVLRRPDHTHDWDGKEWKKIRTETPPATKAELAAQVETIVDIADVRIFLRKFIAERT